VQLPFWIPHDHSFPLMPVEKTTQRDVPSLCPSFELTKRKSRIFEYLRIASVRALVMGKFIAY